jgi:iron complex outermembrane receptor protein
VARRTLGRAAALWIALVTATASMGQEAPAPAEEEGDDDGIEEIIVTSRLREESIQDVPLAVQQFGQEAIESIAPSTLRDFDGLTPNVFIGMNTAGPGASAIYIRGLGYADIEKTQTPNVGVVIDGIFVPSSTGQLIDTFDIESIEINRGPQAILWGRNTSGGTIVVRRGQPQLGEWDAKLLTSYGDFKGEGDGGAFKVQAVANIPLTEDSLALRLGYTYKDEDGYAKNVVNGENRGAVDYNAINAKLLWQPTEALSLLFNWDWIEDRSDIPPQDARWDGNDPYLNKSDRAPKELAPYNVSISSLALNYDLPFEARFTSITAYWDSHDLVYQDFDAGVSFSAASQPVFCASAAACAFTTPAEELALFPAHFNDPQAVFSRLHTRRDQEYDVFSQELRLVGSLLDGSLDYVAGFYFARDDHDHSQRTEQQLQLPQVALASAGFDPNCQIPLGGGAYLDFSGPISSSLGQLCTLPTSFQWQRTFLTNKSWALFGSLEYELPWVEGLRVNFGVRYIDEQKDFATRFDNINSTGTIVGTPVTSETFCANTIPPDTSPCKQIDLSGLDGSWDDVVFEAGANYQVLDDLMTYYRFAQGFRSGGFSLRGSQPVGTTTDPRSWSLLFDPENVDSHEIGVKSTWLDGRLLLNLAGFFSKVDGAQGSSIISGITPTGTNTLILNGGKTEIYGVELQTGLELLEGLNVDFNLGWQKGEAVKSVQSSHNLPAPAGDTVCSTTNPGYTDPSVCPTITFRDNDVARTPELTWSIGGSYRRAVGPGDVVLGTRVRHNDFFWIIPPSVPVGSGGVPTNTPVGQDGYTLLDANLSYEFEVAERAVRVGFVGRNLTDKQYKEQELPLGPGGFRGWGPPRYLGGELQLEL